MFASGVAGASSCPSLGICGQSNPSPQRLLSQNLCSRRNFRGGISGCGFFPVRIWAHPQAGSRGWWGWERGWCHCWRQEQCGDKLRDNFPCAQGGSSSAGEPAASRAACPNHQEKSLFLPFFPGRLWELDPSPTFPLVLPEPFQLGRAGVWPWPNLTTASLGCLVLLPKSWNHGIVVLGKASRINLGPDAH